MKKKHFLLEIISYFFILLFLYAGLLKILDFKGLEHTLYLSPMVKYISWPLAVIIPASELAIAYCLYTSRYRKWGLMGSFVLMGLFTIYIGFMIRFAPFLPCSCGGIIQHLSWKGHMYFNSFCTLLAFVGIRINKYKMLQDKNKVVAYS